MDAPRPLEPEPRTEDPRDEPTRPRRFWFAFGEWLAAGVDEEAPEFVLG